MIRKWLPVSWVVIASVAMVPLAQAQEDKIPAILEKAMNAAKKLRYSGTRRVQMKFGPDTVQHTEHVMKDGMKTRIWFPDEGSFRGQIIVETERERRHFFPDRNQIELLPPRREESFGRLMKLGRGLKMQATYKVDTGEEIAGIDTKKVEISSEKGLFMRMWIDPKSGLVLKRVMYGRDGSAQATSEFSKVDLRPQFRKSDFELNISGAKIMTPRDRLADLVSRGGFQSIGLSPKDPFQLESVRIQRIENVPALVQVYVNKNGRVSLFQVKATIDPSRLKRFGRGELQSYSWQKGGASFVLLSELPESELKAIFQRIRD